MFFFFLESLFLVLPKQLGEGRVLRQKDAESDPSGMCTLPSGLPQRERWGTSMEPHGSRFPCRLPSLLCSEFFSLKVNGLEGSVVPFGPQAPQVYPLASLPGNTRSRKHLVLWSLGILFNMISFLLTFIKTNIEQSTGYTPSRDTLPLRY